MEATKSAELSVAHADSREAFADVANLYLGGFLSMSPIMFGVQTGPKDVNAHLVGVTIITLAIAAIYAHVDWEEWLNLVLGLWLVVAPWVLHFESGVVTDIHFIIGSLVAALAAAELWVTHRRPYRRAPDARPI